MAIDPRLTPRTKNVGALRIGSAALRLIPVDASALDFDVPTSPLTPEHTVGAASDVTLSSEAKYAGHDTGFPMQRDANHQEEVSDTLKGTLDEVAGTTVRQMLYDAVRQAAGETPLLWAGELITTRTDGVLQVAYFTGYNTTKFAFKGSPGFNNVPFEFMLSQSPKKYSVTGGVGRPPAVQNITKNVGNLFAGHPGVQMSALYPRVAGVARIKTPRLYSDAQLSVLPAASGAYTGAVDGAVGYRVMATQTQAWLPSALTRACGAGSLTLVVDGGAPVVVPLSGTLSSLQIVTAINAGVADLATLEPDFSIRLAATTSLAVVANTTALPFLVTGAYQVVSLPGPYTIGADVTVTIDGTPWDLLAGTYTAQQAADALNATAGLPIAAVWQEALVLTAATATGTVVVPTSAPFGWVAGENTFLPRIETFEPTNYTGVPALVRADTLTVAFGVDLAIGVGHAAGDLVVVGVIAAAAQETCPLCPYPWLDQDDMIGANKEPKFNATPTYKSHQTGVPLRLDYVQAVKIETEMSTALEEADTDLMGQLQQVTPPRCAIMGSFATVGGTFFDVYMPLSEVYSAEVTFGGGDDFHSTPLTAKGMRTGVLPQVTYWFGGTLC